MFYIAYFVVLVAAVVGWVMNVINVINALMTNVPFIEAITGTVVLQIVGIFVAPLGAILGYVI